MAKSRTSKRGIESSEEFAMAVSTGNEFNRPLTLALAAVAVVGWLLVAYLSSQSSDLHAQLDDGLKRAEVARQGLAADLQNLQKSAGTAADLKKQADDAQKALTEAASAQASAQTTQQTEAQTALANLQNQAKAAQDAAAAAKTQREQAQTALTDLQSQEKAAQDAAAGAKTQQEQAQTALADLQSQ